MHDITIRANGYDYYEAECKTVKSVRRSNGAYVMTYRCMSEENNGILKKTLYLDQEQLFILDRHCTLRTARQCVYDAADINELSAAQRVGDVLDEDPAHSRMQTARRIS